ncbi:MAG TPA: hypothetical protein VES67_06235 [Vicinamibacterales bacterium]|nr:hypothetical protein [Vicinamibacterales bacterium]
MIHNYRLRIAGVLAALSIFVGPAACGGGGGGNQTPDPVLASITLDSGGSVNAGATIQGTATLDRAAKTGGAGVTLTSSNTSVATVPGTVFIPEGATSERFTVTGVSTGSATITGNFGGSRTATVNVASAPIDLVSVTLAVGTVNGPGPVQGTATISGPAPSGGTTVGLSSSNSGAATVPGNVTVPQGSTTANFTVTVMTAAAANVTITGSLGSTTRTANLAINALPIAANFVVIPNPGTIATGQQCEVQSVPSGGGTANLMKCTFDASSSTPQVAITSYIWRFPQGNNPVIAFTRTTPTLSGITLACGSFGTGNVGTATGRDITLEIVTPNGNAQRTIEVTFIRNGPCG